MSHRIITGDCIEVMKTLDKVDVCIFDPPYSANVHSKSRAGSRKEALRDGNGHLSKCAYSRKVEFGFDPISVEWMEQVSDELIRIVQRWVLVFCDVESVKIGATPQFTGDRPGVGFECVVICHKPGRKRWNGGGAAAIWHHLTCMERGGQRTRNNTREHPTQKPLSLMLELVELFSNAGETILDLTCGAGSTLVAAVRLGRHAIGIEQQEKWATIARERCAAEDQGSDVVSYRAGQIPMFAKGR